MDTGRHLRIGILGGGGILGAHAPGYAAAREGATVVAVAEPNERLYERIRELVGPGVKMYGDYRQLLEAESVDGVDILLPHDLHMPAAVAAARAGRHVLVEKVMARNIWECDRMIEACQQAGVTLTVCHDRRYAGEWMALKRVVDSGALGEIHYWKLDHNQDVNLRAAGSWAVTVDGVGGGAVMSCLTHQIDALRWLGGEAERVTCMTKCVPERMDGELIGVLAATMKSGALAHLAINWETRSQSGPNELWYEMAHVTGSAGEAYYMSGRGTFVRLHNRPAADLRTMFDLEGEAPEGGFARLRADGGIGHPRCVIEWLKLLRGEANIVSTTGRDARATVELAEGAYRSVRTGRVIRLPINPTPWPQAKRS